MSSSRHALIFAGVAILLCGLASCPADKTTPCGDAVCRSGFTCDTVHEVCVVPDQLEVCVGEADGAECLINGNDGFVCDQEVCLQSECGDGILDVHTGEECDDGNHIDDDECPNSCTLSCGNGTADAGEECDGADLNGETCTSQGFDSGQLECDNDCTFDLSACTVECGNGTVHSSEGCDDDNTTDGDGCSATCEVEDNWECQGSPSVCNPIPYDALVGGGSHVCAHRTDDTYWCWGLNSNGQVGDGGTTNRSVPSALTAQTGIVQVALGGFHSCALVTDGTVWCWGADNFGQLGDGIEDNPDTPHTTPVQISGLTDVTAISAGGGHTCALKSDGTVWCWGWNIYAQLGDGNQVNASTLVQVAGLTDVASVSCGGGHTCVVKTDQTVWCWGWSNQGQVGNGSVQTAVTTPTQVSGLASVSTVVTGLGHSCVLLTNGTVWCWGWNLYGQVGSGVFNDRELSPVQVSITDVVSIAAGVGHTCALQSTGAVRCWGDNTHGELGEGTNNMSHSPLAVSNLDDASILTTLGEYTCVIREDGSVWCWGRNDFGQLADGTTVDSNVPVASLLPN